MGCASTSLQVLPRELDEFIELQLEEINPALQRAGVPWRSAWRTAEFGNTYERLFVTPMEEMGELDGGGPLARTLDPDRLARIRDRVRRCLAGPAELRRAVSSRAERRVG